MLGRLGLVIHTLLPGVATPRERLTRAIDRPLGFLLSFLPALLLSILTPPFLPSSVSLSYFIRVVSMRQWLGKYSCMSSTIPIAILNGLFFLQRNYIHVHKRRS